MNIYRKTTATLALLAAAISPMFALSAQAQAQTPSTPSSVPIATPVTFSQDQVQLEHAILARQVQLAYLGVDVADAANLTSSDRAALVTILTNEASALATDASNAAAATTEAQLQTVRQAMIGDERVYLVVSYQVNLVVNADNDSVTEAGYTSLVSELTPLVSELGSTQATKVLADVTSQVSAATTLTSGISADALGLSPSGYPGNASEIKTWDFQLSQAQHDLNVAKADVKLIEKIALGVPKLPHLHV
ncbi:MAG TPA: hypothetical protein VME46_02870 [Acidimicrobiales bacterium]|nr:hypothetical protein [Acidimicrobiales bacterium]